MKTFARFIAVVSLSLLGCGDEETSPPVSGVTPGTGTPVTGVGGFPPAAGAPADGVVPPATTPTPAVPATPVTPPTPATPQTPGNPPVGTPMPTPMPPVTPPTPVTPPPAAQPSELAFVGAFTATEGSVIPPRHKCPMPFGGGSGENISPALEWTGAPAGTMSYALVLYDAGYSMLHWVIWDIPATVQSLPEGIQPGFEVPGVDGARQAAAMGSEPHGYAGPCSSGVIAGRASYEFRLYAVNVATLGLTANDSASAAQAAIEAAAVGMVTWTGNTE